MAFKDYFVSHSHHDEAEVKGLVADMEAAGLEVYVDVDDPLLAGKADAALAARLRDCLQECRALLVVASSKSADSGWIPWELGFAYGVVGRICVLALDEDARTAHAAREYFELYEWITPTDVQSRLIDAAREARVQAITPAMLEQICLQTRLTLEQARKALLDPLAGTHLYSIAPGQASTAFGRGLTRGANDTTSPTGE